MNNVKILNRFVEYIFRNSYIFTIMIALLIPFLTLPVTFATMVLIGFLFQSLYYKRLSLSNYPYKLIDILSVLVVVYSFEFFSKAYNLPTYYAVISGLLVSAYLMYRVKFNIQRKVSYLSNSRVAFLILLLAFSLSWFASGILNFETGMISNVTGLYSNFGFFPLTSPLFALMDFLSVFATITASPWFMINMGVWMGLLGSFRVLELNKLENKIRYLLMMFAYAFYSIWLPNFSPISSSVQYIPYMWFNGLGTYGPVEPSYLIDGIIGTFAVTAILSFLFGGRQICSVTCTAPFMLQGTFQGSMRKYNRSSKLGRKTLTSKMTNWYKWVIITVWVSLIVFAVLSYFNYEGVISFSVLGNDVVQFYASLYFNVIWYFQFMFMPFLGNYACVTEGICAWGTFNQFFGYLGLFKLKVKDPQQCLNCKTVDCALACPVGLTDMRANFIKKGEFKSFKCIGVGDCVEACPHDNIVFHDVRSYLKKFSLKLLQKQSK
ncbi:4Fe-4S ferredoxin [Sulfolobus acidocaldarius SUSAZ]|nr:4Fe-4S ferredoxin [Sulfolobus acidocaldarius SUSAZ]